MELGGLWQIGWGAAVVANMLQKRLWIAVAVALAGSGPASAAGASQRAVNKEFGIAATFPAGVTVCVAESGGHPHGFYSTSEKGPSACRSEVSPSVKTSMGVYANYNSDFQTHLSDLADDYCKGAGKPARPAIEKAASSLKFGESISCAVEQDNHSLVIYVLRQGGQQTNPDTEKKVPYINYTISLATSPRSFDRDMVGFRNFVANLKLANVGAPSK